MIAAITALLGALAWPVTRRNPVARVTIRPVN